MKKQVSMTPVIAIALVIVAAVAFFVLLKPKMNEGAQLDAEIAELESKVATASRPKPKVDGEAVEPLRALFPRRMPYVFRDF